MATSNIMKSRRVTNDGLAYRSRRRSGRRGIALPLMGLLLGVFLAFMTIILDGGYLYFEKRRMQLAADAGSWDGAWELLRGNSGRIVSAGRYSARLNGYTDAVDGADVQITQLNATDVEAVVRKPVPTFFASVFNVSSATVAARAVSSIRYPGELCILALNQTKRATIDVTGTGTIKVKCGVQANSCFGNPNMGGRGTGGGNGAFRVAGVGNGLAVFNTQWAGTCGASTTPGEPTTTPEPIGYTSADPDTWMAPSANPFRDSSTGWLTRTEPEPDEAVAPWIYTDVTIDGNPNEFLQADGKFHLLPGRYNSTDGSAAIEISAGVVVFHPGIFYIQGLKITGGGPIGGDGVTLYNMGAAGHGIDIVGSATGVFFQAPPLDNGTNNINHDDADNANMVVWCSSDSVAGIAHKFGGNSETEFSGIILCETGEIRWGGTHGTDSWGIIIADKVTLNGTADMTFRPPPTTGGILIPELLTVTLTE